MPSARVMRSGAISSNAPRARLNQPSPLASRSLAVSELGPVATTFGSPSDLAMLEIYCIISQAPVSWLFWVSRLEHDLDAAVLLVAEHLVHLRSLIEAHRVRDDERGVDLP